MFLEAVLNFCHKSDIDDDDDGLFAFDDSVAAATAATAATAAGAKVAAAAIADTSLSRNESFRDIELIDGHANSNVIFSYIRSLSSYSFKASFRSKGRCYKIFYVVARLSKLMSVLRQTSHSYHLKFSCPSYVALPQNNF